MINVEIKKGSKIKCENGHLIANVLKDIYFGQVIDIDTLEFSTDQPNKPFQTLNNCDICGGHWFKGNIEFPFVEYKEVIRK
jgi:hypothetical protein